MCSPDRVALDALQVIKGLPYEVATTNADSRTGDYSLELPIDAPLFAPYSSTLPIITTAVPAAAGKYTIRETAAAGNTAEQTATVTTDGSTTVDFGSLQ